MEIKDFCTGLQHIGLPTNDIEATIAFYQSLGFEVAYRTDNRGEAVAFLQLRNLIIETYQNHEAEMKSGAIDHVAIDVKEIDDLFRVIAAGNYRLVHPEVQYLPFWEHGVKFFTIVGPNEEKIEFCERLSAPRA